MEREVRPVDGFPGYFVSNYGEVYSTLVRTAGAPGKVGCRAVTGGPMRRLAPVQGKGHKAVHLFRDGVGVRRRVSHLVLEAFVEPRPQGMQACHFPDRDVANNRLDNLRWDTPKSNQADKVAHGTTNDGERNGSAKLTRTQVVEILRLRRDGWKYKDLASTFGVSVPAIQFICTGKTWKTIERPV